MSVRRSTMMVVLTGVASAGAMLGALWAADENKPKVGYKDTPLLPGGKWHVHDGDRPQPPIVTPGTESTQDAPGKPPSDAVVLFDGSDLSKWTDSKGKPSGWILENGAMITPPAKTPGGGEIRTKDEFGDCQLHVEWSAPNPPKGRDQGRGNSGVFLFGRYEVQVLDCYDNITYADGYAGAVYGQTPPMANACRKPGEWNTYDIIFTGPRFKDGQVETPAYLTLIHNGVLLQNHTPLLGATVWRALAKYSPHGPKGYIALQDHGNPVRFRNIWIRELKPVE